MKFRQGWHRLRFRREAEARSFWASQTMIKSLHFILNSVGIHWRDFSQGVGRPHLDFEVTFAALQWVGSRGRWQDEASGADHRRPDAAWVEGMPGRGGEGGRQEMQFKARTDRVADVMEEDTTHKGGVQMNPVFGLNWWWRGLSGIQSSY